MCSQWVNKYSIMRDLSKVQGRVPVDVAGVVAAADQPPTIGIDEENEKEFYHNCTVENGDTANPDLNLIKHMLNMVRDYDFSEEDKAEEIIQSVPFSGSEHHSSPIQVHHKVQRKSRNVAIASLLQKEQFKESTQTFNDQSTLPTPENMSKEILNSVKKVNGWLNKQEEKEKKVNNMRTLNLDPTLMFKKKVVYGTIKPVDKVVKSDEKTQKVFKNYVPSSHADEYYKLFQQKSKMKEMLNEDIWSKVARHCGEIDEQRKQFAQFLNMTSPLQSSDQSDTSDFDDQKFDHIRLPHHRHVIADECLVCAVKLQNEVLGKITFPEKKYNLTVIEHGDKKQKTAHQELEDFIGDSLTLTG